MATLFLAACGGGGGDGGPPAAAAPASGSGATAVQLSSSITAEPNKTYEVVANGGGAVDISLAMPNAQPGNTVRVTGIGAAPWRLTTGWAPRGAANLSETPIVIDTRNLAGNPPPGQSWTARLGPMQWHWVASDRLGRVLVAMDNPGQIHLSRDAGQTWDPMNSPVENWVSASVYHSPAAGDANGLVNVNVLAAGFGGGLYETGPNGWTAVQSGIPGVSFAGRDWESVSAIDNGRAIVAMLNAPIYHRLSATATWLPTVLQSTGQPLARGWRGVALSQTGVALAASQDGDVYVSTDLAAGWVARPVVVNGTILNDSWYRTAISPDGRVMALAGRFNSGLYLSRDQGLTWTRANTPAGDYTALSINGDGSVIAATITNASAGGAAAGSVQVSRDGGQTFAALQMPGADTNWRAVALSDDGNAMTVAAGTFTGATGQLYTSVGNRTSYGAGSLGGGQGSSVELVFEGSSDAAARWSVRSSSGNFTVR
ncbi:WD40/YVTN/BNR-like repeat-containing protein [Ramlibacter henchirensis]|uniref:WD40/YVTN/BNR-like repeat-containing protein n=1 Tax=Ramlibacter henchirensis TaxID=204072 RepID=UPI00107607FF|nr:sialidase family protein [Ramlibacter henchirensis]